MKWWSSISSRLLRRKIFDPAAEEGATKLDRCLTLFDLTSLGVGATLGVGIYVLAGAVAKDVAGPSVVLSFLIAGIASSLSGLCYAELGSRVPKAGSAYVYSYVTVGEGIAFVIGWNLILEYAIGTASVARGYSGYIDSLIDKRMATAFRKFMPIDISFLSPYPDFCALIITLTLSLILCIGVKESTRFNNIFTCLNIFVVVFVTICGWIKADFNNWRLEPEDLPNTEKYGVGGFFPYGVSGTLAGAATCFYGFVGFDTIATSGEEAQNPQRNIPLAIVISLSLVFVAYFGISSALTLMLPYYMQDETAPLPYAFHETGWIFAGYIVSGGALFGLSTSLLGAMFPLPRVLYAMASDGLLFQWLSHIHPRYQTPFRATVVAGLLAGIMASMFELKNLVDMMSIGTLMAYTIVGVAVIVLRYRPDEGLHGDYIALSAKKKLLPYGDSCESESENEEIIYCNDENPVLSKADRLDTTTSQDTVKQLLLCPWSSKCGATEVSAFVANIFTFTSTVASFILALILIHSKPETVLVPSLVFVFVILFCTFCTFLLPIPCSNQNLTFRVPLVPLTPQLSITINLYLMLKLSLATWVRFTVWMSIGAAIYAFYGWSHSKQEKRN